MLVKICGLRRKVDIEYANELKPDFIGFVFCLNKMRTVTPKEALELKKELNPNIKAVGVFRNNTIDVVREAVSLKAIDMIQLHGGEDDDFIKEIRSFTDMPIIRAYKDSEYADYLLFDNDDPGKGQMFDWSKIQNHKPFFLAGGITLDNLSEAKKLNPYCIDVSSSVETDGFKDYNKMKEFIRGCRDE